MSDSLPAQAPGTVPFGQALRFWLKLGCISFGGPAGQIALMHRELVQQRGWVSQARFMHALNYCMLLPGPEAQQLATYIGWLLHRTRGGIAAGVLFVLPSLLLMVALSALYLRYGQLPGVAGVFHGIKAAVAAVVLQALWRMGGKTLHTPGLWALAGGSWVAIALLKWPFPLVVLGAALLGAVAARVAPQQVLPPAAVHDQRPAGGGGGAQALAHTRFLRRRLLWQLAAGALLWALPLAALLAWQGRGGVLPQMAWFFSKAALMTFGGAYAVLPYVNQAAVQQHQWLTAAQMMDGLALGETTPGPLIMIVAFIGFLGAAGPAAADAAGQALASGAMGAVVATWFTFLPSFIFILVGAPLVESTHGKLALSAPLAAVGAAVVGVMGSLALFFMAHVAWPQGAQGPVDGVALVWTAVAAWALMRRGWGVVPVIALCGLAGWLRQQAGALSL